MAEAHLFPILTQIGSFDLHTYGALGAAGFLLGCWIALRHARRMGWSPDSVIDVIFYASVAAIMGARLVWMLQNPGHFQSPFDLINLRSGGLVFYGAFLGFPAAAWAIRRHKLPTWEVLDMFGQILPLAHGISRLGCLGAGCCYGLPTTLPWGVLYTDPLTAAPRDVPRHPTQVYEAIGLFLIFGLMTWLSTHKRFSGQVVLSYALSYAALRSVVELFRGDADRGFVFEGLLGPVISTSQGVSIVVAITALALWRWRSKATAA